MRIAGVMAMAALIGACDTPANPPPADPKEDAGKAAPTVKAESEAKPGAKPSGELGRFTDGLLPLAAMLGQGAKDVEAVLGEPVDKGGVRESCVRFVPDRVWFKCYRAWQRYADKNGKLKAVRVVYEDNVATAIGLEGLPGTGPFDPAKALELAGLELPGKPRESTPSEGVTVWSYFNNASRLKHQGREYRVEVSAVGGAWDRAKVEVILNDHLNEDEAKRKLAAPAAGKAEDKPLDPPPHADSQAEPVRP